jgi:hypothetical protein
LAAAGSDPSASIAAVATNPILRQCIVSRTPSSAVACRRIGRIQHPFSRASVFTRRKSAGPAWSRGSTGSRRRRPDGRDSPGSLSSRRARRVAGRSGWKARLVRRRIRVRGVSGWRNPGFGRARAEPPQPGSSGAAWVSCSAKAPLRLLQAASSSGAPGPGFWQPLPDELHSPAGRF